MSNPNELIDDATVDARLGEIPGWERRGNALHRDFTFADFTAAFGFMAAVACVAERLFHHPEWSNVWNRVSIAISNHAPAASPRRTSTSPHASTSSPAEPARRC